MIESMFLLSVGCLLTAFIGLRKNNSNNSSGGVESYFYLVQTNIKRFNQRLFSILVQFFVITNLIYFTCSIVLNYDFSFKAMIVFDLSIALFSSLIFLLMIFFPNVIASALNESNKNQHSLIRHIVHSGLYQNLSFFSVFLIILTTAICVLDSMGLISLCLGVIVTSFYFRSAGGAYKAAGEHQLETLDNASSSLTHPAQVLKTTGGIIASVGGLYLDIYGSWLIAISTFFILIAQKINPDSLLDLIMFPEVRWVLIVVLLTGLSVLLAFIFNAIRKKKHNIFLDIGYFIMGLTFTGALISAAMLKLDMVNTIYLMVLIMVVSMLGIIFFTNYLTSSYFSPIQFICRQAQYGAVNVLISSFFSGLVGNALIILILILVMAIIYSYLNLIGLIMLIIYGLSIIVVACNVKLFSLIANQVIVVLNYKNQPQDKPMINTLSKISASLEAIGNAFSSVAGILSSIVLFSSALMLNPFQINLINAQSLFAGGLGIVAINIFYALSIGGTYETLITSSKEIKRQLQDIPYLNQDNKAHPNMHRLGDKHAANCLKAVTLPGIWIIIVMSLIYTYLSNEGVYSALIGMFLTVLVFSFFWSIFGDSLVSVYNAIKSGRYGGDNTTPFSGVIQSFLYAHYFQWVLAPTGVIIMKLAGIIALIISVK